MIGSDRVKQMTSELMMRPKLTAKACDLVDRITEKKQAIEMKDSPVTNNNMNITYFGVKTKVAKFQILPITIISTVSMMFIIVADSTHEAQNALS